MDSLIKVQKNGTITIPAYLRRQLNLKTGDKIIWFYNKANKKWYLKKGSK